MATKVKLRETFGCLVRRDAVSAYLEQRSLSKRNWKNGDVVRVTITLIRREKGA